MNLEDRVYYEVDNTQLHAAIISGAVNPRTFYKYLVSTPHRASVSADETRVIYKTNNQADADILEFVANANYIDFWKTTKQGAAELVATDFWLGL